MCVCTFYGAQYNPPVTRQSTLHCPHQEGFNTDNRLHPNNHGNPKKLGILRFYSHQELLELMFAAKLFPWKFRYIEVSNLLCIYLSVYGWQQLKMHHQMLIVMRSADLRTLRLGRMCSRAFFSAPELPLLRAAVRHSALGSRDLGSDARRPGSVRGWCAVHAAILRSREAVENTDIMGVERRLHIAMDIAFSFCRTSNQCLCIS